MNLKDPVYDIAEFAVNAKYENLPKSAVNAAKFMIKDALALVIAGSNASISKKVCSLFSDWGGKQEASVLASDLKVPAHNAAFLNSLLIHALDFDDTHDKGTMHVSPVAFPVCLVAGQLAHASGRDILSAMVSAVEIAVKLSLSITESISVTGWIYTAICQYISAAAVSSVLLGLDVEQTVMAIGNAYAQAGGSYQVSADSADTKRLQPAFAARDGIISAELALSGISGCHRVIDGDFGFKKLYLKGCFDSESFRATLVHGSRYEIENLSYKPYPSCRFTHSGIDAAKKLMSEQGITADDIISAEVLVSSQTARSVCLPIEVKQAPKTIIQAQYSIPFTIAMTLIYGTVDLKKLKYIVLSDQRVLDLSKRITPVISEELDRKYGRTVAPCIVKFHTAKGDFQETVEYPLGSPENPFTENTIINKLHDCIQYSQKVIDGGGLNRVLDMIDHLEEIEDINIFAEAVNRMFGR